MPEATKKRASKRPVRKRGNPRQMLAVRALIEGATLAQALRDAGYSESTALAQNDDVVVPIREKLLEAMAKHGITSEALGERLKTRLYSITTDTIKDPNGKDYTVLAEDSGAQLRALELIAKIIGAHAPTKTESKEEITVNIEDRRKAQQSVWERLGGID